VVWLLLADVLASVLATYAHGMPAASVLRLGRDGVGSLRKVYGMCRSECRVLATVLASVLVRC